MFTHRIVIDLGTANTIIIVDGQIVVDEPSVVAIRRKDEQMVAVGRKAAAMIDHGENKIYTVRPLKQRSMVVESKAYTCPSRLKITVARARRASSTT